MQSVRCPLPNLNLVAARKRNGLLTQAESLDKGLVDRAIGASEVLEKAIALAHHEEESATRSMILRVGAEMLLEASDALGKDRDLNFW